MLCSRCLIVIVLSITLWVSDESLANPYQSLINVENKASLKIINGAYANISAYPITAAFLISNDIWGAGAIYNKNWIVTTAYNCFWVEPKYMSVRVGSSNWTEGGQLFAVDKCVLHPAYNASSGLNNIAMVKLRGNVTFGEGARVAYMPPAQDYSGRILSVAGWGVRSKKYIKQTWLQISIQTVRSVAECSKEYNMTSTSICAYNETSSPCIFDFGAPLMLKRVLVGLYEGSKDCTEPKDNSALYLDIFKFKEWMENIVNQN